VSPEARAADLKSRDTVLVDRISEADPAYPIVTAILRVVPASRWAFARPQHDGELGNLLTSDTPGSALADLKSEHSRQREQAKTGSRIAATLGALGDYASGLTLIFADGKASFGILTLLRTREMGPFTSSEIAMLGLALESGSERLSLLRLHAGVAARSAADLHDDRPSTDDVRDGESYVLDQDLQIVMTWTSQHERRAVLTGLRTRLAERLPAVLEDSMAAATRRVSSSSKSAPR
jgi:hypothetical protein